MTSTPTNPGDTESTTSTPTTTSTTSTPAKLGADLQAPIRVAQGITDSVVAGGVRVTDGITDSVVAGGLDADNQINSGDSGF